MQMHAAVLAATESTIMPKMKTKSTSQMDSINLKSSLGIKIKVIVERIRIKI